MGVFCDALLDYQVIVEEETYRVEKDLPVGVYAHHLYHIHPPLVMQNLLPVDMAVEAEVKDVSELLVFRNHCYINQQYLTEWITSSFHNENWRNSGNILAKLVRATTSFH